MRSVPRVVLFVVLALTATAVAAAHPLGNFTINHLAKIYAQPGALRIRYILDIAEIPTFQIMHAQGDWDSIAMRKWTQSEIAVVRSGFHVRVNGEPIEIQAHSASASLRAGAGGLPILRWVGTFSIALPGASLERITVTDAVYGDRRIGWKDIDVGGQSEPTNELRSYPSALIGTPRRINAAAFTILPSGIIASVRAGEDDVPMSGTLSAWVAPNVLSDMLSRHDRTLLFVLMTVLAAFGLGALHAVEPGHGKALLAFTLVGARATSKQALILAISLTVAHTAGVLLLGIVLFSAAGFVSESIYPWITTASGAAIAVIGARALAAFLHKRGAHQHAAEHRHARAVAGTQPLDFRTAIVAAMSGGIAPCPAAIVLLLAALRMHEVGYGIALILVFSMGLASVLSGLGIAVVHGAAWLSKRSAYHRFAPYGPLVTAVVICAIGAWTFATGLAQQGIALQTAPMALAIAAAIAGYALTRAGHEHTHSHAEGGAM